MLPSMPPMKLSCERSTDAIGNTSEPVMATPPGAASPVSLTPPPTISFAELTAKLTNG
jgi:hypothetical protein